MIHGSLFTGLGGFNIASDEIGWETIFNCEIDKFCQRVLKYYWPDTIIYDDIKKTDFTKYRGTIDVLSGGPPCQPISVAGKRKGDKDDRWLWPETIRAVREIAPTYCVFENPTGILSMENGRLFKGILTALENEGYEIECFVIPACSTGAPHRRDRVWIIAYSTGKRTRKGTRGINIPRKLFQTSKWNKNKQFNQFNGETQFTPNTPSMGCGRGTSIGGKISKEIRRAESDKRDKSQDATDTNGSIRRKRGVHQTEPQTTERYAGSCNSRIDWSKTWDNFPTQSPIRCRDDGFSARLDNITFPKWRNESIKAYGNAIVPHIAYEIFKAIDKFN